MSARPGDEPGDEPGGDRSHAAAALVVLRGRVDAHFDAARERSPGQFRCGPGCHACCLPGLGVFGIEAERIRGALRALQQRDPEAREAVRRQASDAGRDRCALLVDGRCGIYDERPMLCRSHGLPVLGPDARVSGCPLNFTTEDPPPRSVLELAAVDAPLAVMAQMWDGGRRVALADLARDE